MLARLPWMLTWMLTYTLPAILEVDAARMRCRTEEDCPRGAYCFKDECPRCICPQGQHQVKLFSDGQLYPLCEDKPPTTQSPLVGEPCNISHSRRSCPYGSVCADSGTCACKDGMIPNDDRSYCRLAMFGETCDAEHPCQSFQGLQCQQETATCVCSVAFHRPNEWTRFILQRWNYTLVEEGEQKCVARAVGEPCGSDMECSAVGGSGAFCGLCGFCQCRRPGDVPDVLGTKCGPGLSLGDTCSLHSPSVCDGRQGLQCGDVCDLYSYSYRLRLCTCSQMHDKDGSECKPKVVGSPCSTDLDCYPIQHGYGYCHGSRCAAHAEGVSAGYQPHLADRLCGIEPVDIISIEKYSRQNGTGHGPDPAMDVDMQVDNGDDGDRENVTLNELSRRANWKQSSVHSSNSGTTEATSSDSWIYRSIVTTVLVLGFRERCFLGSR